MKQILFGLFFLSSFLSAGDWPQGAGRGGNFATANSAPTSWSVVSNETITWRLSLPETGQSTPVIHRGLVFFTTLQPVEENATLGKNLDAWAVDAKTGEVLWKRRLKGTHNLRLSGCFSDSSSPPAVCFEDRVIFTNASGGITCFDLEGKEIWSRDSFTVGRTLPFLCDGKFVFTRQIYPPEEDGNFPHKYADASPEMWTQLQALNVTTGEDVWTTQCGVNMGCAILPQRLSDGRDVVVVGRGGGHGPPEKPDGISLVDLADGKTLWTVPLEGFMATMSYRIRDDTVHVFHLDKHITLSAADGAIENEISIVANVPVETRDGKRVVETINAEKKKRMITQSSNLLVGPWHYFRSYTRPYLGRVHVERGTVEYLELPLQKGVTESGEEKLLWFDPPKSKKDAGLHQQVLVENELKNSRGFVVFGDKRSKGSGWGHVASPTPSVAGDFLYVPVMNGTVYVLRWNADQFTRDEALVSINDLGPPGIAWTRASLSFADGRIFAHTMRALICIGE